MRRPFAIQALGCVFLVAGSSARAQEALVGRVSAGTAGTWASWSLTEPIPQGVLLLRNVSQFALPVSLRFQMGDGWTFEAGGAAATGHAEADSGGARRTFALAGLTDLKVRLSRSIGNRLLLTAGANLPTGTTGLDGSQTTALQALAAPALQMPVSAMGLGPGATVGLIRAMEAGSWAFALGTSVEMRTEYTAVELALTSGSARTTVTPGTALHLTFGGDRPLGDHRLGFQVLVDAYTRDRVQVGLASGANVASDYSLGPQFTALAHLDVHAEGWRSSALAASVRHRTAFTDGTGETISGSSGTYVEATFGGVRGGTRGAGFVLAADARYHTGLPFTEALVGAKHLAAGITIGAEVPVSASSVWRFTAHPQYGTFDTGRARSSAMGVAVTIGFGSRMGAR